MASIEVNLRERFVKAFGVSGKRYLIPNSNSIERVQSLKNQGLSLFQGKGSEVFDGSVLESAINDSGYSSPFGTEMFDVIVFSTSDFQYLFEFDPIVDFKRSKKITETVLSNGDSVVEVAGVQPTEITIRGVLWGLNGEFPESQLNELIRVFEVDAVLNVRSRLFNYHQIGSVYIKSLDTPALEGFEDTQPFIIEARSIKSASLVIQQNQI